MNFQMPRLADGWGLPQTAVVSLARKILEVLRGVRERSVRAVVPVTWDHCQDGVIDERWRLSRKARRNPSDAGTGAWGQVHVCESKSYLVDDLV